ncbi:MAG: YqhA family protein [Candidatus Omnitrophica bacterium]|nr:YqhA family protein [Candidatus Omnitrophota bacterium]
MKLTWTKKLELTFETVFWKSRAITFFAVIFSLVSSLILFLAGSYQILEATIKFTKRLGDYADYNTLVISIIGAVDLFLIGIVLLIFSFGIYELFISKIDPAEYDKEINILEIKNLDSLKNKLLKVIIMVMVVHFFKMVMTTSHVGTPLDMLYLGGGILLVSACTFFIRKIDE